MKAADRCSEHYQGDRCRLPKGHTGDHKGQFSVFEMATVDDLGNYISPTEAPSDEQLETANA